MGPSLLSRTCLLETLRLTLFYGGGYMALVAVALVAPLVDDGAHLGDVLLFLPNQLAFPATIVIPMAFATAIMAVLGRMQEDGELIAMKAAGISSWRLVQATLPLAVVLALTVGWLAHDALPRSYLAFREAKASLVRQGIATRVAREEPIIDHHNRALAAIKAEGQSLRHVFGWSRDRERNVIVAYAPRADWQAQLDPKSGEHVLQLSMVDSRWLVLDGKNDFESAVKGLPNMAAMHYPRLVMNVTQDAEKFGHKPDGKATAELARGIPQFKAALARLPDCAERQDILTSLIPLLPDRIGTEQIRSWRPFLIDIAQEIGPEDQTFHFRHLIDIPSTIVDTDSLAPHRDRLLEQVNEQLAEVAQASAVLPRDMPLALQYLIRGRGEGKALSKQDERRMGYLILRQRFPKMFRKDALDHLLLSHANMLDRFPDRKAAGLCRDAILETRKALRGHQMAWHLRNMLACSLIAYWLFAAGLGLQLASRNRMLAASLGMLVVALTVLPGIGLVKGLRGKLDMNPAWIIWSPQLLLVAIGSWLCWKQR